MEKNRVRKKGFFSSVSRTLLMSVTMVIILVTVVVTYMSGRSYSNMVVTLSSDRLGGLAKITEGVLKRANVDKYFFGASLDDNFEDMRAQLKYIVESTSLERIGFIRKGTNGEFLYLISTSDVRPFSVVEQTWESTFADSEYDGQDSTVFVDKAHHIVSLARDYYDVDGEFAGIIYVSDNYESFMDDYTRYQTRTVGVVVGMVFVIIAIYSFYLAHYLIIPVKEVTAETLRFASEKDTKIEPHKLRASRRRDELGVLANGVTTMETDILAYIDSLTKVNAEKSKVQAELSIASAIQKGMMPTETFPDRKEFEIYAAMKPARAVGGDFYDYYFIDPDHLAIVVADVSGKGIPAALFMMIAQMLIRQILEDNPKLKPSEVLSRLDGILNRKNSTEQFVTVWLGILDVRTGEIVASNAGHEYPIVSQGVGDTFIDLKDKHNPPCATIAGIHRSDYTIELRKGDSILLYTDGVTEATNKDNKLFGMDNLVACLNKKKASTAEEHVNTVLEAVDEFRGSAEQFDDITLINLIYLP